MYRKMCDICGKNPATQRVINFTNTKKEVQDICDDCFHKRQQGVIFTIIKGVEKSAEPVKAEIPQRVCRVCGTTAAGFMQTGLVGCDNCYVDLAPEILQMIRATQGQIKHLGKTPDGAPHAESLKTEDFPTEAEPITETDTKRTVGEPTEENLALKLKKELEAAVLMEDYEKAIELRDRLAAMTEDNRNA